MTTMESSSEPMDWSKRKLDRKDWDFSLCGNDEDQLLLCRNYEYAREVPKVHEAYSHDLKIEAALLKETMSPLKFAMLKAYFDKDGCWYYDMCDNDDIPVKSLTIPRGFPEKPYLATSRCELKKYDADRILKGLRCLEFSKPIRVIDEKKATNKSLCLEIKWSFSNTQIANALEEILPEIRERIGHKHNETRGKKWSSKLRKDLNSLGAYRLLKKCGNAKNAMQYTAKILGKPLFGHKEAWSEAKSRAEHILAQDFLVKT